MNLFDLLLSKNFLLTLMIIFVYFMQEYVDKIFSKIFRYALHTSCFIILLFGLSDSICEKLFDRMLCCTEAPCGLDPDSTKEMLNYKAVPKSYLLEKQPKEAIVIIHGMGKSPANFRNLAKHFEKQNKFDIYLPLLKFHGRDLKAISDTYYEHMIDHLHLDLQYILNKGYDKIYCIGHSLGGSLLVNLSLANNLHPNFHLILYAPALSICVHDIVPNLAQILNNINKYPMFVDLYGNDPNKLRTRDNSVAFYPPSSNLFTEVSKLAKLNESWLNEKQINNKFSYLIGLKDRALNVSRIIEMLDKQNMKKQSLINEEMSHSPHIPSDMQNIVYENFDQMIDSLRDGN